MIHRMVGKGANFEEKVSESEKRFIAASEGLQKCKSRQDILRHQIDELEGRITTLTADTEAYNRAKRKLEKLHESLFAGDTTGCAEEDEQEVKVSALKSECDRLTQLVDQQNRVVELLTKANNRMCQCSKGLERARGASVMDMFGNDAADAVESSALAHASKDANAAEMLIEQARTIDSAIPGMPELHIAQGHFMADALFDNVFSDYKAHQQIKESQAEVSKVADAVSESLKLAEKRHRQAMEAAVAKGKQLAEERETLVTMRTSIIEASAVASGRNAPAQPYSGVDHGVLYGGNFQGGVTKPGHPSEKTLV